MRTMMMMATPAATGSMIAYPEHLESKLRRRMMKTRRRKKKRRMRQRRRTRTMRMMMRIMMMMGGGTREEGRKNDRCLQADLVNDHF